MKFKIDAKALASELDAVLKTVDKKTTIPILSHVLIETGDGFIRLSGTDLDNWFVASAPAEIIEAGSITVDGHTLSKMTKPLTGELTFQPIERSEWIEVTSGKVKVKFPTVDAIQFPETPEIDDSKDAIISTARLQDMAKNTVFAVSKESSRFTLQACKLEIEDAYLRLIGTDGHRLAYTNSNSIKGSLTFPKLQGSSILVKTDACKLLPLLKDTHTTIHLGRNERYLFFTSGYRQIITRLVDGQFPNYEIIMPKEISSTATYDFKGLKDAVKRASVASDERTKSITLFFEKTDSLRIHAQASQTCERDESFDLQSFNGELLPTGLGFDWSYLLEFLSTVKADSGEIGFKDSNAVVQFSPVGYDYEVKYLVMPLRV